MSGWEKVPSAVWPAFWSAVSSEGQLIVQVISITPRPKSLLVRAENALGLKSIWVESHPMQVSSTVTVTEYVDPDKVEVIATVQPHDCFIQFVANATTRSLSLFVTPQLPNPGLYQVAVPAVPEPLEPPEEALLDPLEEELPDPLEEELPDPEVQGPLLQPVPQ